MPTPISTRSRVRVGRRSRTLLPGFDHLEGRTLLAGFVATKSGVWTDPSIWVANGGLNAYPQLGDTVTIPANIVVSTSDDVVIGSDSVVGTSTLIVQGRLLIEPGSDFTVKGDVLLTSTTEPNGRIQCGGRLIMDGEAARWKRRILLGLEHATTARLVFTGSPTSRAALLSTGTGAYNAAILGGTSYIGAGRIEAEYTDFTRIGDYVTPFSSVWLTNSPTSSLILRHCRFTACGTVRTYVAAPDLSVIDVSDTVFVDGASTVSLRVGTSGSAGSGVKRVFNNRFDRRVEFVPVNGIAVDENHFGAGYSLNGADAASWSWNLVQGIQNQVNQGVTRAVNNYYFNDTDLNPHGFSVGLAIDYELSGFIFDMPKGVVGDMVVGGGSGTPLANTVRLTNSIVLPNAAGGSPGKLASPLGTGHIWVVEHNTVTSTTARGLNAETGASAYGETSPGTPGMYASVRSNLVHAPTGEGAFLVRHNNASVSDVLVDPSMGDYNGGDSIVSTPGSGVRSVDGARGGYIDVATGGPIVPMFTSTTGLGAHDVIAPPQFNDFSRNLATFDTRYLGNVAPPWQAGKSYQAGDVVSVSSPNWYGGAVINYRAVYTHFSSPSDVFRGKPTEATYWRFYWEFASSARIRTTQARYDPLVRQATPRDLYEWVRAGAIPTNPAFAGAAHDGGDIGAVPVGARPVADPQSITIGQETPITIRLTGRAADGSTAGMRFAIDSRPLRGTISGTAPDFVYTPAPGFSGSDSFRFLAIDPDGVVASAQVAIDVVARPRAMPESHDVFHATPTEFRLVGLDPSGRNLPLSYEIVVGPSHGTLTGTAPDLVYTPSIHYVGLEKIHFVVHHAYGTSSSAIVELDILPEPPPRVIDFQVGTAGGRHSVHVEPDRPLPWTGVDRVWAFFDAQVIVDPAALIVTGSGNTSASATFFAYDPATRSAVWEFAAPFEDDVVRFFLDTSSTIGVRTALGTLADFGRNYIRTLAFLPGDIDGDRSVGSLDEARFDDILLGLILPGLFDDVDDDGYLTTLDLLEIRRRAGRRLPSGG
ncbi:MAG: Ig-like domain-containing protein [Isosphaeraceae bacterium]|nr:Ig-like domain-containing protein [Isosphaeraceae bacterium]